MRDTFIELWTTIKTDAFRPSLLVFCFKIRLWTAIQQNRKLRGEQNQHSQRKNCKTPDIYIYMFKHTHDSSVTLLCPKITSCSKINFIFFFTLLLCWTIFLPKCSLCIAIFFLKWNIIVLLTFSCFISGDPKEGAGLCWCYGRKCRGSVFYQRFKANK